MLSAGHACILQYAALHLSGYDLTIDDLKQFRQWGSRTPGHPEIVRGEQLTPGVEISTGPLGQGVGNAVGHGARRGHARPSATTATASRSWITAPTRSARTATSWRACPARPARSPASSARQALPDLRRQPHHDRGLDRPRVRRGRRAALRGLRLPRAAARRRLDDRRPARARSTPPSAETERPSLIIVRTHIAIGAPHAQDTPESHGAPLGEEEVRLTKQAYGWDPDRTFYVPERGLRPLRPARARRRRPRRLGRAARRPARPPIRRASASSTACSRASCPRAGRTPCRTLSGGDRAGHARELGSLHRRARGRDPGVHRRLGRPRALQQLARSRASEAIAGAPLANKENAKADSVLPGRMGGRTLHFGIREHGMGAILNGLIVHGGFRAFGATFFVFSDYMRPAVRLACIMELPVIYVWTHDSIGLGEDGPTHQPIEHLASLRAMPHMRVIRPADATETVEAWRLALERTDGPVGHRALAPEAARARPHACSRPRAACGAAATSWPTAPGIPDVILIGIGIRGARPAGRARDAERPTASARASSRCPTGTSSWHSRRATATRCCRATSGAACRSRPARRSAGRPSSATAARRSGSIATAHRRQLRSSRASSGSRPRPSWQRRARCSSR